MPHEIKRLPPALQGEQVAQYRRADTRAVLALIKARRALVQSRTLLINTERGQLRAEGVRLPNGYSSAFHRDADALPEPLRDALRPPIKNIEN